MSPAERTVRVTATEGSSLSPSASGGTWLRDVTGEGGLNADSGPGRAPLEAHLLLNSETWEKDLKEGAEDSSAPERLRVEPVPTAAVGTSRDWWLEK